MTKIAKKLTELIGHTPPMELSSYSRKYNLKENIIARLESFNLAGSIRDRVALSTTEDTKKRGVLRSGATITEPISKNTGVGPAMVATIKGYQLILAMPEMMSLERRNLLKALGAQTVLTGGLVGMTGSIAEAEELRDSTPSSVVLQQFENPSDVEVHTRFIGEEVWQGTDRQVAMFAAGVGAGGAIYKVACILKKYNPDVYMVAVEPASFPVLEDGKAAPHRIQGIGANFVPGTYDVSVVDEIMPVSGDEAIRGGRGLTSAEGLLAGISSGAIVYTARKLARRPELKGKKIVTLLPDTGERYLSAKSSAFDAHPLD